MNFLKKLPILVAFYSKIHTYSCFKKKFIFSGKPLYFFITAKNSNVFRNLTVSVALYGKNASSSHFRKNQGFSWKINSFSKTAQIVWVLWDNWQIEFHSTAKLPPSVIFEKFKFFSGSPIFFGKTQSLNVLRNLLSWPLFWQVCYF